MRFIKRGTAVLLAALLAVPTQPVTTAYAWSAGGTEGQNLEGGFWDADPDNRFSAVTNLYTGTASNSERSSKDEVKFNTGNDQVSVVDRETFDQGEGDAFFEEDGSYTINIPESNPFFPYEVQFTGSEGTASKWFMTPDDSVEVDGHTFYVSAYFDGEVVTQMSLDVAGKTVVVYPEAKEFTDEDWAEEASLLPMTEKRMTADFTGFTSAELDTVETEGDELRKDSLLPLIEKRLTVDLTGFTPVELTMVKIKSIFRGEVQLKDTDKVMWTWSNEEYTISSPEDTINIQNRIYNSVFLQMIVGDADQLAADNIRYLLSIDITDADNWLIPTVYKQDAESNRSEVTIIKSDADFNYRELEIDIPAKEIDYDKSEQAYVSLKVNEEIFGTPIYDHLKVYKGSYGDPVEAEAKGTDVTEQLFANDMTQVDSGLLYTEDDFKNGSIQLTIVSYNSSGEATGCLRFRLTLERCKNDITRYSLRTENKEGSWSYVESKSTYIHKDGLLNVVVTLTYGYPADGIYYQKFYFKRFDGVEDPSLVTAAYVGLYSSIQEASDAGAENVKEILFGDGYGADYSKGVDFTFFVGEDGLEDQEIYKYHISTQEGKNEEITPPVLSDSTAVSFSGLRDGEGRRVNCYCINSTEDSYGDYSYRTILVDSDVDLTNLAPEFSISERNINLYASEGDGESVLQISGKSLHDFSKGPVHYTASSESKEAQTNYWLQVVQKTDGSGKLYMNSLADSNAGTTAEGDDTIHSTREMIIDGRYNYYHDILLINEGTEEIEALKAEIVSDEVELDPYWTLNGEYPLSGFDTIYPKNSDGYHANYSGLVNMAKIRVVPKENMADGRDISGTLTIKSEDKVLMELTLTGTVGDPSITTTEIPAAVKYVPYGTMIQNNNKYEWNEVSYRISRGKLPAGMVLKSNGELYGVPTETGEFTFTVTMRNSYRKFSNSQKTFTLTVINNSYENVEAATDEGYELTTRVRNVSLRSTTDQTLVSEGVFDEFVDLYLDGVKLTRDEDYTAESGSTKLTIKSETLKSSNIPGTHTLGIEFRNDDDTLKRAAQNYEVTERGGDGTIVNPGTGGQGNTGGGGSGSGHGSSSSSGGSSSSAPATSPAVNEMARKGQVDPEKGIITGEGAGNCHWQQSDGEWQLIYTDGTAAKGSITQQTNGDTVEQVLWEMVNGSWYAFGVDGYVKSGWVYDYQLNGWYLTSVETGMLSGWYTDPQDKQTYYIDPVTGKLSTGWREIDGNWYYFQAESIAPTWELNKETRNWSYNVNSNAKPFGSMYFNERTPDRYFVNIQGIWDGRNPQ